MQFYSNYRIYKQPDGKYTLICFTNSGVLLYHCEDIDSYEKAEQIKLDYLFKSRKKSKSSSLSSLLVNSKTPKFLYDGPYDNDDTDVDVDDSKGNISKKEEKTENKDSFPKGDMPKNKEDFRSTFIRNADGTYDILYEEPNFAHYYTKVSNEEASDILDHFFPERKMKEEKEERTTETNASVTTKTAEDNAKDKGNTNISSKEEADKVDKMESTIVENNSDESTHSQPDSQEATLCLNPKWFNIDTPKTVEAAKELEMFKDNLFNFSPKEMQRTIHEIHALDQVKAIDDKLKEIADKLTVLEEVVNKLINKNNKTSTPSSIMPKITYPQESDDFKISLDPNPYSIDINKIDFIRHGGTNIETKAQEKRKPGRPKKVKKDELVKEE